MIKNLQLKNFTAFRDINLPMSPRINVIIGANGTGKTHLLKAIYGLGMVSQSELQNQLKDTSPVGISKKFLRIFSTELKSLGRLHSKGSNGETRLIINNSDNSMAEVSFGFHSKVLQCDISPNNFEQQFKPVFIPTKEVLSLVSGMRRASYDRATVEMIFEDGYIDLAEALIRSDSNETTVDISQDPRLASIIRELVALVGGRYEWKDSGTFNFKPGRYEDKADPARSGLKSAQPYQDSTVMQFVADPGRPFSSGMTAEGYRKIGMLHRLLCNGSINPGTTGVLLWDEPEANLNPKLMKKIVEVLLALSRNGQQIILATHDYVLLKWLDLLMDKKGKEDHVLFHVLHRISEDEQVSVRSTEDYDTLINNGISKAFGDLYDAEIERSLKGIAL